MLYRKTLRQAPNIIILFSSLRSARITEYTLRGRRLSLKSSISKWWPGLWVAALAGAYGYSTRSRENVFRVVIALGCIQK